MGPAAPVAAVAAPGAASTAGASIATWLGLTLAAAGTGAAISNGIDAKADAKKNYDDNQRAMQLASDKAAEALRQKGPAPTKNAGYNPSNRFERLKLGLASTIKAGAGPVAPPILAAPVLSGGKSKLGA
jgi:hypothetical protein